MTVLIKHRVNLISQLNEVRPEWGVEIDLRADVSRKGKLYLHHDAWQKGDDFQRWLSAFRKRNIRGPLVLNTKEDGLESEILDCLARYGVANYFFLDTAFPTLVRWTMRERNKNFAVRYSTYESEANTNVFRGRAKWLWVDCFDGKPMSSRRVKSLKRHFKICLVSPELQGGPIETISRFKALLAYADAVCTKRPDLWMPKNPA